MSKIPSHRCECLGPCTFEGHAAGKCKVDTVFKFCDPCYTDMKKRQPNLENPIVQHRQLEQEEKTMADVLLPLSPEDENRRLHLQASIDERKEGEMPKKPKIKKRDQELVPPEKESVSVSDVPAPMKPAAEGDFLRVPEVDTEPQPASETTVSELDGTWHGIPLFCIFLSENHEPQMFYEKKDAIACAMRLIATEFSVTICKIAPWRKVQTESRTRIEPAMKRKRKKANAI